MSLVGDAPYSIAIDGNGLVIANGRVIRKDNSRIRQSDSWINNPLRPGETLGIGMELHDSRRVFFTQNGIMLASPLKLLDFDDNVFCAVAIQGGESSYVEINFGVNKDFKWKGNISAPSAGKKTLYGQPVKNPVDLTDDIVDRATNKSLRDVQKPKAKSMVCLMTPDELHDSRQSARTLKQYTESNADMEAVGNLLILCRTKREVVEKAVQNGMKYGDGMVDFEELITVNFDLVDAIESAEKYAQSREPQRREPACNLPPKVIEKIDPPISGGGRDLKIGALIDKKDIFSLICMLRAQSDKRLDSALALMRFAREAERKGDGDSRILRDEIRSSGGLHSLLTLFRTKGATRELRVVAALAVAYLLPSFMESPSLSKSTLPLKIVECLKFLFNSRPVYPRSVEITRSEMYNASLTGLTTFWMYNLFPLLQQTGNQIQTANQRQRARGRQIGGYTFDQRQETLEVQELLETTVSLIVGLAKLEDGEMVGSCKDNSKLSLRYTLVEQMCAVDIARPLAVREGLLKDLVKWMKSNDREKVRPAATSLRDLTSTQDKYMAGWIHSQIVSEGAVREIVQLLGNNEPGVQLAVTQILSSLCVAPHTRAAVVEAQCIHYLISLLFEHFNPSNQHSQELIYAAGSALLQLAAGAMTRARVFDDDCMELDDAVSPDKRDKIINDIIEKGAIQPLVNMASVGERGKLRSMSIEVLRVISEDTSPVRETRLRLCRDGAAGAVGNVLQDDVNEITSYLKNGQEWKLEQFKLVPVDVVNELHQALCTLANMLDISESFEGRIEGCVQIAKSGGLKSLLTLSYLPFTIDSLSTAPDNVDLTDLLIESCRSLAALSPLLLSEMAAVDGHSAWTCELLHALTTILKRLSTKENTKEGIEEELPEVGYELKNDSLRGLAALAKSEPLQPLIVDKCLPLLAMAKAAKTDRNDVANTASHVFLALGYAEDELATQVAGNDAKLLGDWFCMQRSLLIQAMAREEIRHLVVQTWKDVIAEAKNKEKITPNLVRECSAHSSNSSESHADVIAESGIDEVFENIVRDEYSAALRDSVLTQYERMYKKGKIAQNSGFISSSVDGETDGLLKRNVYPLNDVHVEKEWILGHQDFIKKSSKMGEAKLRYFQMGRLQHLLNSCIPSKLLQSEILPLFDLRPEASFNFRALNMPQRRYFSFRREGQLVQSLCDKQAADGDSEDAHWTLGFTNSSFAGEFSETLVQSIYRCPIIRGLSFIRNSDWEKARTNDDESDADEGSSLLANLAGSLPPWVSDLTFDNVLNERSVKALVAILETMGKLSEGQDATGSSRMLLAGASTDSVGQKQGSFRFLGICNSPLLKQKDSLWDLFFSLLGRPKARESPNPGPLASLRCLDLSGNDLGDENCASVLGIIHQKEAGCQLEQLDLSRNLIKEGARIKEVFLRYVNDHRYNHRAGLKISKSWRSSLSKLNLSSNKLNMGNLAMELIDLLKNDALSLKTLNMSCNDLEFPDFQFVDVLCGSLKKNTSIMELNLSGNKFDLKMIDNIIESLKTSHDSGVCFLRFEQNTPILKDSQISGLESFQHRSRSVALDRFRERQKNGAKHPSFEIDNSSFDITSNDSDVWGPSLRRPDSRPNIARNPSDRKLPPKSENTITVLFSAPLVFKDERNKLRPFAKLDFDMERELLWQCLKEAKRDIQLSFDNATIERLLLSMQTRSSCLHYSGHGHQQYLPFEDGKGGPNWFQNQTLKTLLNKDGRREAPFKFVFVSACHSGLAGETFASAGVQHVVCCKQESELKDTAALAFTRNFYSSLAIGNTVKDSFELGCKAVRATPNLKNAEREMKKFVLLPRDGNHDVPVFNACALPEWPKPNSGRQLKQYEPIRGKGIRGKGLSRTRSLYFGGARSSELSTRNMMQEDASPSPPQFFMGREVDMYHVLCAILEKRLVSVIGDPGIGRSSLVCALCHYMNERKSTITVVEHIFYVKTKQGRGNNRCRSVIQTLINKLVEAGKLSLPPQMNELGIEDLFDLVFNALKNVKAMIVFDRTELLQDDDTQRFLEFLSSLFLETRSTRVLLTARSRLGLISLGGVTAHYHDLCGLTFEHTVRLFAHLCPHLHTNAERQEFFNRLILDADQADVKPDDVGVDERTKRWFEVVGNGMPAKIEKAAYTIPAHEVATLGKEPKAE